MCNNQKLFVFFFCRRWCSATHYYAQNDDNAESNRRTCRKWAAAAGASWWTTSKIAGNDKIYLLNWWWWCHLAVGPRLKIARRRHRADSRKLCSSIVQRSVKKRERAASNASACDESTKNTVRRNNRKTWIVATGEQTIVIMTPNFDVICQIVEARRSAGESCRCRTSTQITRRGFAKTRGEYDSYTIVVVVVECRQIDICRLS